MKTKDWTLVILTLLLTIILDQLSKKWAVGSTEKLIGFFHMIVIHNEGAMLGLFSKLPAFLRIVTLSTSGFFILSLYAFFQFIIPTKVFTLRIGLSLLVGGIIGNVLDRTLYGYVIDFISIQTANWHSPIWNLADMIQWVGYTLVIYSIFKHGELLWPDKNGRTRFWINKKFQLKYAFVFITSGLLISMICLVFSYTYFKISLQELGLYNQSISSKYTEAFLYSYLILILTFSVLLFLFAKFISHQTAGPIYAFERFLIAALEKQGLDEEVKSLKLRAGDDFKHLEELADQIKTKLLDLKAKDSKSNN